MQVFVKTLIGKTYILDLNENYDSLATAFLKPFVNQTQGIFIYEDLLNIVISNRVYGNVTFNRNDWDSITKNVANLHMITYVKGKSQEKTMEIKQQLNEGLYNALMKLQAAAFNFDTTSSGLDLKLTQILLNHIEYIFEHCHTLEDPDYQTIQMFFTSNIDMASSESIEIYSSQFVDDSGLDKIIEIELPSIISALGENIGQMNLDAFIHFKGLDTAQIINENEKSINLGNIELKALEQKFVDYVQDNPQFYFDPGQHLLDIIHNRYNDILSLIVKNPALYNSLSNINDHSGYTTHPILKKALKNLFENIVIHNPDELNSIVFTDEFDKVIEKLNSNLYDFNKPISFTGKPLVYSASSLKMLNLLVDCGFVVDEDYLNHLGKVPTAASSPERQAKKEQNKQEMMEFVKTKVEINQLNEPIPHVSPELIEQLVIQKSSLQTELSGWQECLQAVNNNHEVQQLCQSLEVQIAQIDTQLSGLNIDE